MRYTHDTRGVIQSITRHAALDTSNLVSSTHYTFDPKVRLTDLEHRSGTGATLVDYTYERDAADQLLREIHHGKTYDYTHDLFGQVTESKIDGLVSESYQYDLNGNRVAPQIVMGLDNRLAEDANYLYTYDDEGNLTRRTTKRTLEYTEFTYDHRNRLTRADDFSAGGVLLANTSNTYDVFDRLITRTHDADGAGPLAASVRHTVYDGEHAWADYDGSGNMMARYLFQDGIDQIAARWRPGEGTAWYLTDHLGTVRDLVDDTGAVVNTISYDLFGKILGQTGAAYGDRFTYTGREWDEALQFYYYRARFYDPSNGRFLSQDPLMFAAGDTNLYRYVGNNPVDLIDPTGNTAMTECAIVRFGMLAVDMQCTAIQMLLKGEFKAAKSVGHGTQMYLTELVFGGQFSMVNADGTPMSPGEELAMRVERAMHYLNVATMLGGGGLAMQLTMKSLTLAQTSAAIANLIVNGNMFQIMGLAETWVRGAYAVIQDPQATFQQVMDNYRARSDVQKALLWSEIVCGAANLGLMVMSASARCFVAGTPVVVDVLPPQMGLAPTEDERERDRYGHAATHEACGR
jgi:RHS repeat-associated protein